MKILKPLSIAVIGLSIGLVSGSAAFAKGHDQGVADGTPKDASLSGDGRVAGRDLPGVGIENGVFLGVAADLENDLTYGLDIVQNQVADDLRRVVPVVNGQR